MAIALYLWVLYGASKCSIDKYPNLIRSDHDNSHLDAKGWSKPMTSVHTNDDIDALRISIVRSDISFTEPLAHVFDSLLSLLLRR